MTSYDVAKAVLQVIADHAVALSQNADILAGGWRVDTQPEDLDGSTDDYKFLKVDDRDAMPDGLNVFVTPGRDRDIRVFSGFLVHKEATLYIGVYLAGATAPDGVGVVDPHKVLRGKRGVMEAFTSLLNRTGFQIALDTEGSTFYGGRITETDSGMMPKPSMNAFVPGVQFTYTGTYAVQETDTDGAQGVG